MKDLRNNIAGNNQAVEKAISKVAPSSFVYVLTGHVKNGYNIDEAFANVFQQKNSAVNYVKNFIEEVKGNFGTCQVDYGKNFEYTKISADGFCGKYSADLSIEKQSIQRDV